LNWHSNSDIPPIFKAETALAGQTIAVANLLEEKIWQGGGMDTKEQSLYIDSQHEPNTDLEACEIETPQVSSHGKSYRSIFLQCTLYMSITTLINNNI